MGLVTPQSHHTLFTGSLCGTLRGQWFLFQFSLVTVRFCTWAPETGPPWIIGGTLGGFLFGHWSIFFLIFPSSNFLKRGGGGILFGPFSWGGPGGVLLFGHGTNKGSGGFLFLKIQSLQAGVFCAGAHRQQTVDMYPIHLNFAPKHLIAA